MPASRTMKMNNSAFFMGAVSLKVLIISYAKEKYPWAFSEKNRIIRTNPTTEPIQQIGLF
jgi:hypothetical protein